MMTKLRKWFNDNYGDSGYSLYEHDTRLDILKFGVKTKMNNLSLEKIMDFTAVDIDLLKLVFDALFRHHGYEIGEDFKPIKQVKEFKL